MDLIFNEDYRPKNWAKTAAKGVDNKICAKEYKRNDRVIGTFVKTICSACGHIEDTPDTVFYNKLNYDDAQRCIAGYFYTSNSKKTCPNCGKTLPVNTLGGYYDYFSAKQASIAFFQKLESGVLLRAFEVIKKVVFKNDTFNIENSEKEFLRILYANTGKVYVFCAVQNGIGVVNNNDMDIGEFTERRRIPSYISFDLIPGWQSSLADTFLTHYDKYLKSYLDYTASLIGKSPIRHNDAAVAAFYRVVMRSPLILQLFKNGFYNIAHKLVIREFGADTKYGAYSWYSSNASTSAKTELKDSNFKLRKLSEFFEFDYQKIPLDLRKDFNLSDIDYIKRLDGYNQKITAENLDIVKSYKFCGLEQLFKTFGTSRVFKYVRYQAAAATLSSKLSLVVSDYADYLRNIKQLNWDMTNRSLVFPQHFKDAHDATNALLKAATYTVYENGIKAVYDKLHELCEWQNDDYILIMPDNPLDIVKEGESLSHCVARYCERVAKNESIILFLRKTTAPQTSFVTVELKPDMRRCDVVQARGFDNKFASKTEETSVNAFLKEYERWFNSRKAPKNLTSITARYYKAVSKLEDGRLVSIHDGKTEYKIGDTIAVKTDKNPDSVNTEGIHIASLDFAKNFGQYCKNAVILECEVDIHNVIIPNAVDQIRASKIKVVRELSADELGEWAHRFETKKAA